MARGQLGESQPGQAQSSAPWWPRTLPYVAGDDRSEEEEEEERDQPERRAAHSLASSDATFLLLCCFMNAGVYFQYHGVPSTATLLRRGYGLSAAQIGTLQAMYSLPTVCVILFSGMLVDRIGL